MFKKVLLTTMTLLALSSAPPLFAEEEYHTWNRLNYTLKEWDKFKLRARGELRTGDWGEYNNGYLYGATLGYRSKSWLSFAFTVRGISLRSSRQSDLVPGVRYEFEFTLTEKIGDWLKVDLRNRYEYLIRDNRRDVERWRPLLRLSVPWNAGPIRGFYAETDYFLNLDTGATFRHRTIPIGVNLAFGKTKTKVFYMLEDALGSDRPDYHILGTEWSF